MKYPDVFSPDWRPPRVQWAPETMRESTVIERLPLETLQHIFLLCLSVDEDDASLGLARRGDLRDIRSAPWNISRVSKHWRYASHSYPPLWSSFRASLEDFDSTTDLQLSLLEQHVQRATNQKLSIVLSECTGRELDGIPPFGTVLERHSHQIQHLGLDVTDTHHPNLLTLYSYISRGDDALASLRSVYIDMKDPWNPSDRKPLGLFNNAPLLTSVTIHRRGRSTTPIGASWELPLSQLTTLTLHSFPWPLLLPTLNGTKMLQSLTLTMDERTPMAASINGLGRISHDIVDLVHLSTLRIRSNGVHMHEGILRYLNTPSLSELDCDTPHSFAGYASLFQRSDCRIKKWTWRWTRSEYSSEPANFIRVVAPSLTDLVWLNEAPIPIISSLKQYVLPLASLHSLEIRGLDFNSEGMNAVVVIGSLELDRASIWFETRAEGEDEKRLPIWEGMCRLLSGVRVGAVGMWVMRGGGCVHKWAKCTPGQF